MKASNRNEYSDDFSRGPIILLDRNYFIQACGQAVVFLLVGEEVTHLVRMPPPEDDIRTGSEDRNLSQPPPLAKTFWKK